MRITAEEKQHNEERILTEAKKLFRQKGFQNTTTRDIAKATNMATGTLFNYFPSKEALVMKFILEAVRDAKKEFFKKRQGNESIEEDLFSHITILLRKLKPYRKFLVGVLELIFSPFIKSSLFEEAETFRTQHLELVHEILNDHNFVEDKPNITSPIFFHLYWTLYQGILSFWLKDKSDKQENTLVLVDQYTRLFVGYLNKERQQ